MGYFPNGMSGIAYEEQYCDRCVHQNGPDGGSGCQIWLLHLMHNYEECNNEKSMLHDLIPLSKDRIFNEQCTMFHEANQYDRRAK